MESVRSVGEGRLDRKQKFRDILCWYWEDTGGDVFFLRGQRGKAGACMKIDEHRDNMEIECPRSVQAVIVDMWGDM